MHKYPINYVFQKTSPMLHPQTYSCDYAFLGLIYMHFINLLQDIYKQAVKEEHKWNWVDLAFQFILSRLDKLTKLHTYS